MNMELLQLQKEVRELRQQNFVRQNDIQYVPFNIISNNLYINNSLNKSSINTSLPQNNSLFNSFLSARDIQNKKQNEHKRKTPYGKLPIKKGMFSYKTSLNNENNYNYKNKYNYINMFRNKSNNIIEVNEPYYDYNNYKYNNNSLLSAELKLNLDDNSTDNNNNLEQNKSMGERISSTSSLNLNKYKINRNNIINQKKNALIQNDKKMNNSNKIINISNNNGNSSFSKYINNNNQSNNISNNTNYNILNKSENLNFDAYKNEAKNNLSMAVEKKKKIKKIADHFKNRPKYEKESRRMIIELIKILNKKENINKKVYSMEDIEKILVKNNISKKVLNKEFDPVEFNIINLFNKSSSLGNIGKTKEINNKDKNDKNNSINSSFKENKRDNSNEIKNKKKQKSKNLISPIKKNINDFLKKMNDVKKDKINIISFLSVPRIMNLYFMDKKYTFIFVLSPSNICYEEAIESYIFKFADINTKEFVGGFDLIKVRICSKIQNNPNKFYIETFNEKVHKNYIFEAKSSYLANYYVKGISYLAQLVKCKLFNLQK